MKKFLALLLVMNMAMITVACAKAEEKVIEKVRAVKVQKIEKSGKPVELKYIGTVDSKDMMEYSFKSPGKMHKVFVKEGDQVKKGDRLVQLDIKDLQFQVNASRATLEKANLAVKKAKDAYTYAEKNTQRMKRLYEENVLSQNDYEQVKLNLDVSKATYEQVNQQSEEAKTDYEHKSSLIQDGTMYSKIDGSIVKVCYDEGEFADAGYPVVVVRTKSQVVNVGFAQKDISKIALGTKARVDVDGHIGEGTITNIAEAPDEDTRTYKAEVTVKGKHFRLGSIAKVNFEIGNREGVWIPITSVSSDGEDYVYIVKDGRAFKRTIELGQMYKDYVMITKGLKAEEAIVLKGMKNLTDGIKVKMQR